MSSIPEILDHKRQGLAHSPEELRDWVLAVTREEATDAQVGAWLAWAYVNGLSDEETVALTRAMVESGERLSWNISGTVVDKHSPGGVGDKTSHVIAPLWAALGYRVPMISGRSLLHTGGTLDKLEALPGYRTDLPIEALQRVLGDVGCFINGQTGELAPADKRLYALRDETRTVTSVQLITASILSKKLAAGLERLVLVLWVGSGGNIADWEMARGLARLLPAVGERLGLPVRLFPADMSQPLGRKVGNLLEMQEAAEVLRGGGPPDVREVVLRVVDDPRAAEALDSGAAWEKFQQMVRAHGGDPSAVDDPSLLAQGRAVLRAERSGWVTRCDAREVGLAALELGAGRTRADQSVRPDVGVLLHRKRGERVEAGEPLAELVHAERGVVSALEHLRAAYAIADEPPEPVPLFPDFPEPAA